MKLKKRNNISGIFSIISLALPVIVWVALLCFSGPYLRTVEERSLFEYDSFWVTDFLAKPSGTLSLCSLFLTQFLHLPWLGSMIWVLLLTATALLTKRIFQIPDGLWLIAYIPAAIMLTYNMSMGYIIYAISLPGFFFIPVLGYLWALLTVYVLRKAHNPAVIVLLTLIWGFAGYYIAGFYSLAGIIVSAVDVAASGKSRSLRLLHIAASVTVVLFAPIAFIGTTTYGLGSAWTLGLPEELFEIPRARLQAPLVLTMLLPILAPAIRLFKSEKSVSIAQYISLALILVIPFTFWYRDSNYKAELKMILAVDNCEWDKAIAVFENISSKKEKQASWQPTRIMVMLKDLALIKTDKEADKAFAYDDGSMDQKTRWTIPSSFQIGKVIHFHYGIPGLCHRWCFEESVLLGWSNMTLKYHAMNSIATNQTGLAERDLSHLERTLFYRKWAKEQRALCHNRDKVAVSMPYNLVIPLICYDDEICTDKAGCEYFIMQHFNGTVPLKSTPLYDRIALFYALKSKQPALILTRFLTYMESNNPDKIGRHYQEAAYLCGIITHNSGLQAYPFDDRIKKGYDTFSKNYSKYGKRTIEESRSLFSSALRHSYYYYYYYVNELRMF